MAQRTYLELQNDALHDDFDPTKYRAKVKRWMNEAIGDINRRIRTLGREASAPVNLIAGTTTYALPADYIRVRELVDPVIDQSLSEKDLTELDELPDAAGFPYLFALDGENVHVYPTPGAARGLLLRYWRGQSRLVNDNDVPSLIGEDYDELLVEWSRKRLFRMEDDVDMSRAFEQDYETRLLRMMADLQAPSRARVKRVPGTVGRGRPAGRFSRPGG